jgi:hypothetical protein
MTLCVAGTGRPTFDRDGLTMKHTTSRVLFDYWDALRGERAAPERSDVEPGAIRSVLADTFLLDLEHPGQAVFRLAGTRCAALFGSGLRGQTFESLWPGHEDEAALFVDTVVSETLGLVVGLVGTAQHGARLDLELVLLPLRHWGRTHLRMIGAISPATVPSWMGLFPITSLEATSLRVLRDKAERGREPAPLHPIAGVRSHRRGRASSCTRAGAPHIRRFSLA